MQRIAALVAVAAMIVLGCGAPKSVAVVDPPTPYPTYTPYPTLAPLATHTAYPTYTPFPTWTRVPTRVPTATATAAPTDVPPTATPIPTATAVPPTEPTAAPATQVPTIAPVAEVVAAASPVGANYEPPVLVWPEPKYDICDHKGDTVFRWRWDGQLKADEYFQVQIVSRDAPNLGEHRGIHAPTKDYTASTNRELWGHFRDWENVHDRGWFSAARIYADWTVAIVQWDGIDASRIGPIIVEAAPCDIRF